jgi:hypothetical protein
MEQQLEDEISLKELLQKLTEGTRFLLSKWLIIGLAAAMGAGIGFYRAFSAATTYTARISFVAEEGKSGNTLASLAGQFGFDVGGAASSGGNIFSGENLILFLKSEGLIRETLLSAYDSSAKTTLADKFAQFEKFQEDWNKNEAIGKIDFSQFTFNTLPRKEDSLLQTLISSVSTSLSVSRPDKKASFVEVKLTSKDELFSKIFVERLVATGTQRYIISKTKVKADNVALLQKRADSLGALLNNTTYSAAASQQILVDVNPALRTAPVNAEISTRQKMMLATIFGEVIKNLELAKFSLSQETPVIQVVDKSYLPLKKEKPSKLKSLLVGGFLAGFLMIFFLMARRWYQQIMKS